MVAGSNPVHPTKKVNLSHYASCGLLFQRTNKSSLLEFISELKQYRPWSGLIFVCFSSKESGLMERSDINPMYNQLELNLSPPEILIMRLTLIKFENN